MPTIFRLEDDEIDALYAWIDEQLEEVERLASYAASPPGFTPGMDSWSASATGDAVDRIRHLHRPSAVFHQSREQRALLVELKPHLYANTPVGKLARTVLQRLGASLSSRMGYREEWRP